jgi:hypothetical protein
MGGRGERDFELRWELKTLLSFLMMIRIDKERASKGRMRGRSLFLDLDEKWQVLSGGKAEQIFERYRTLFDHDP